MAGAWRALLLVVGLAAVACVAHRRPSYERIVDQAVRFFNQGRRGGPLFRLLEATPPPRGNTTSRTIPLNFRIKETVCLSSQQRPPQECPFREGRIGGARGLGGGRGGRGPRGAVLRAGPGGRDPGASSPRPAPQEERDCSGSYTAQRRTRVLLLECSRQQGPPRQVSPPELAEATEAEEVREAEEVQEVAEAGEAAEAAAEEEVAEAARLPGSSRPLPRPPPRPLPRPLPRPPPRPLPRPLPRPPPRPLPRPLPRPPPSGTPAKPLPERRGGLMPEDSARRAGAQEILMPEDSARRAGAQEILTEGCASHDRPLQVSQRHT
nr:keratinocyte proline-rich protein-like [Dasypus novemcinctus]